MTATQIPDVIPDQMSHQLAFTEISFLLDIFASTIAELMGGATSSVGRIAGRELARKLPIDNIADNHREVIEQVATHFKNGFDIRVDGGASERETLIQFGDCAIREVCKMREINPGDELCQLFHYYFDGVINELVKSPVKSDLSPGDEICRCNMRFK
ncbi:MAG: hypothetical protein JXX14_24825 [Deltaproteobacteria bacterium]|nr:hypothetical protein [Deltaproteobacteria bacterium]